MPLFNAYYWHPVWTHKSQVMVILLLFYSQEDTLHRLDINSYRIISTQASKRNKIFQLYWKYVIFSKLYFYVIMNLFLFFFSTSSWLNWVVYMFPPVSMVISWYPCHIIVKQRVYSTLVAEYIECLPQPKTGQPFNPQSSALYVLTESVNMWCDVNLKGFNEISVRL